MKEISVIGGQPHGHAAEPLTAEVFLGARLFRAHFFVRAPLHLSCKSLTAKGVRGRKSAVLLFQYIFGKISAKFSIGRKHQRGGQCRRHCPPLCDCLKNNRTYPAFLTIPSKKTGKLRQTGQRLHSTGKSGGGGQEKREGKGKGQKRERAAGDKRARKRKRLHSTGRWGKQSPAQCRKVGAAGEKDKTGFGGGGSDRKKGDDRRK